MPKLLKIGIIGCGAIGSSLAKFVARELSGKAELAALFDTDLPKAEILSREVSRRKNLAVKSQEQLIERSRLVIESASAHSSWEIAKKVLARKRDILIMSVGGITGRISRLSVLAAKNDSKVYIPSGAVCGIDALKAAKTGAIRKVVLTTRKNPISFRGVKYIEDKGIRLDRIRKDKVLFSGPAREAVKYFPQNINVAGVLSIAGIGKNKTYVRIIASPAAGRNVHEVYVESDAGKISCRTENVIHPDNPRTSYLAVLSAAAAIKQILEPVKIGT